MRNHKATSSIVLIQIQQSDDETIWGKGNTAVQSLLSGWSQYPTLTTRTGPRSPATRPFACSVCQQARGYSLYWVRNRLWTAGFRAIWPEFKSGHNHWFAVTVGRLLEISPYLSYLISLYLSSLTCKMEIIIVPCKVVSRTVSDTVADAQEVLNMY